MRKKNDKDEQALKSQESGGCPTPVLRIVKSKTEDKSEKTTEGSAKQDCGFVRFMEAYCDALDAEIDLIKRL